MSRNPGNGRNGKQQCQVCSIANGYVHRSSNGAWVCSACRTFVKHHCDNESYTSLVCKNGNNQCLNLISPNITGSKCSNGSFWSFTCAKCRFQRCIEVGIVNLPTSKTALQPSNVVLVEKLISFDDTNSEETMEKLINGVSVVFEESFNNLPGMKIVCTSKQQINECFLANVMVHCQLMGNFMKKIPGFTNIDFQERCALFSKAVSRVGWLTMAAIKEPRPLLFNDHNMKMAECEPHFFAKVCFHISLIRKYQCQLIS